MHLDCLKQLLSAVQVGCQVCACRSGAVWECTHVAVCACLARVLSAITTNKVVDTERHASPARQTLHTAGG